MYINNLSKRKSVLYFVAQLNVLMVGIDSISRLNFRRQFPKTYAILKNKLHAFEMYGYNKVRDNTFVNLVPMFLGNPLSIVIDIVLL